MKKIREANEVTGLEDYEFYMVMNDCNESCTDFDVICYKDDESLEDNVCEECWFDNSEDYLQFIYGKKKAE